MTKLIEHTLRISTVTLTSLFFLCSNSFASSVSKHALIKTYETKNLKGLTPTVLKEAVNAYDYAIKQGKANNKNTLTIVNFSQPSYKRRMWVIDTKTGDILLSMHVAQGKNSGQVYAKHFSNRSQSYESSPGIYLTLNEYTGKHGKSMRIEGLEPGINSNAEKRAIVIHPAWYLKPSFIEQHGYAGRSWGCFAINPNRLDSFLGDIKDNSVLFAYAPSEKYDTKVNHTLSSKGKALYQKIAYHLSGVNLPKESFFERVKTDLTQTV